MVIAPHKPLSNDCVQHTGLQRSENTNTAWQAVAADKPFVETSHESSWLVCMCGKMLVFWLVILINNYFVNYLITILNFKISVDQPKLFLLDTTLS